MIFALKFWKTAGFYFNHKISQIYGRFFAIRTKLELITKSDRWNPLVRAEVALFAEVDQIPHIPQLKKILNI
jgi:hypothetical protein